MDNLPTTIMDYLPTAAIRDNLPTAIMDYLPTAAIRENFPAAIMDYLQSGTAAAAVATITAMDYPKTSLALTIVRSSIFHWIIGSRMKVIIAFKEFHFAVIIDSINLGTNLSFMVKIVVVDWTIDY